MTKRIRYGLPPADYYKGMLIHAAPGLHPLVEKLITDRMKSGSKIFDAGAGEGAFSQRLADSGYQVTSADINSTSFKASTKFVPMDFNKPEELNAFAQIHKGTFDAVVCMEVLEHIHNPWQQIAFFKSLLKEKGMLVLSTPNTGSWLSRFLFFITGRMNHFQDEDLITSGHITPLFDWQLQHILQQNNFSNIEYHKTIKLPWYVASRSFLYNMAFLKAPFYRLFMQGRTRCDILLVTADC